MSNKKILLLTTIYPAPDLKYGTPSVHYFAKEWVKMGYEVKVIHYQAVYPKILYLFASLFREKIASLTGAVVFTKPDKEDKRYELDRVDIFRFPIFKWIPHGPYTKKTILRQVEKILKINKKDNFKPDMIIGHFSNPQLKIVSQLKDIYNAKTCMIMHDNGKSIKKIYKKEYKMLMSNIDVWGYRSKPIKDGFEDEYGEMRSSFFCYSGIPVNYISHFNNRSFSGNIKEFIYVGEFIKRKFAITVLQSINEVYSNEEAYKLNYVGRGAEEKNIKKVVEILKIKEHVAFSGFLPRNEVQQLLDKAECFIMISKGEAFGLVYLEAMGRGCITIGSKSEGIDGVIEHGKNGFLCEAGNEKELADVLRYINSLTKEERQQISQNAITTVKEMTDYKVATKYINEVMG